MRPRMTRIFTDGMWGLAAFVAIYLWHPCHPWSVASEAARPNIILMMADDMGMGDTSAYQDFTGNADDVQVHTPNMERLAQLGTRFTDAHTPSSRCSPTAIYCGMVLRRALPGCDYYSRTAGRSQGIDLTNRPFVGQ